MKRAGWRTGMLLACLAFAFAPGASAAQESVALPDTAQSLLRGNNGVDYKLYIGLPPGHTANRKGGYPLLVLLDADYSFPLAHAIVTHLRDRNDLPEMVIVGVAYAGAPAYRVNRTRDYTPTHVATGGYGPEVQRHSGGAPAFHRFLQQQLLPHMAARYGASGKRVLVGHSYGGLFATWSLLQQPASFDGYIIVSPSLWYDGHLPARLEAGLDARARQRIRVEAYAAVGALEINAAHDMPADLRKLDKAMTTARYPGLRMRTEVLDGETHNSVFPRALSNGLRAVWPRGSWQATPAR